MLQRELRKLIWTFLLPSLVLYLVIGLWPNIEAFYWALTKYDGIAVSKEFIGFTNFTYMMADDRWWTAVQNTAYFAVGTVVTLLPFGLLFAVLIMNIRRGHGFFKTSVYIPSILSVVIVAFLWAFLLDPTVGVVNPAIKAMGLDGPLKELLGVKNLNWLGNPKLAKFTIVIIQLWQGLGFYAILFMAGLAKIPRELNEAARIDGASGWSLFRHITWPLIFPTTQTCFLLLIINGMQIFTLIYSLTGGAPTGSTQVMATYIYRTAFSDKRFGYATALSVILMAAVMFFTLISREMTKKEVIEY